MTEVFDPYYSQFGYPEYCAHAVIGGLYGRWDRCGLVENKNHTNCEKCDYLRNTGRCLHP